MGALRTLQEAVAQQLKTDPWLEGVAVLVETPESRFPPAALGGLALRSRLTVLAPAFLLNEVKTEESAPRILRGEALLTISVEAPARPMPEVKGVCASELAEQVLCLLHGWTHSLGSPGVLRAERQAIAPGAWSLSPLSYVLRYAKGGTEKFRREIRAQPGQDAGLPYYVHFWTELDLTQQTGDGGTYAP